MARDFTSPDRYEIASAVVTAYPFTLACWFYPDSLAANRTLMDLGSSSGNHGQRIYATSAALIAQSTSAGGDFSASTSAAPTTGKWQHAAGVFDSATDRRVYLDGGNKGTNASSRIFNAGIDRTEIGARLRTGAASQPMEGRLAECCVWNVSLTDDEVYALSLGYRPTLVRPDALVIYVPLIRDVCDLVGNNTLSVTGAPAVIEHPRRIT